MNNRHAPAWGLFVTLLLAAGCARLPVREISDARILLEAAKNSCARVYMPEELERSQEKLRLVEQGSRAGSRKSTRELRKLALEIQGLSKTMINQTARTKADLYAEIQQKIVLAIKKIHEGEKAEANRYARKEYRLAIENVREARKLSQDECSYPKALEKSRAAFENAEACIVKAAAFKRELEHKLPVYHIVREGETLKSIAKESPLYGDEAAWEVIYKANRDQIRDPDSLYPGQQLYLPRIR